MTETNTTPAPPSKAKLTKALIDKTAPREKPYIIWDTEVIGLGLHVAVSARRSFVLRYRTIDHTQRKPVLGTYGAQLTLDQARGIARDMLAQVRAGRDPSAARQDARDAPTVADACDRFLREHASRKKPLTKAQYEAIVEKRIKPAFGTRKVASIDDDDVGKLIHRVGKEHPVAANRMRAVLSKLFSLCERWGLRARGTNPAAYVDKYAERQRHRDLNAAEQKRLAEALAEAEGEPTPDDGDDVVRVDPRAVAAIRLLVLTGCRRNEILRLRWSEVDLERGFLHLGDSKTGRKSVILNETACWVLENQTRVDGNPYVFPSSRRKGQPIVDIKGPWQRIRARAGLDGDGAMRLHDLRHHHAAMAAAAGLSLPVIGRLLGHKRSSTTERYALLADDPARSASELVGKHIAAGLLLSDSSASSG